MNKLKVDYHIHTTASDGKSSPTAIVKKAKELEYDEIAITDHDNVDGIQEALIAAEAVELKLIPGIEIAVETSEGIGLHLLGYRIDYKSDKLKAFLDKLIHNRKIRNKELFSVLQSLGYDISEKDIKIGPNGFVGKPLIARTLQQKGYIKTQEEAFGPKILGSPECRKVRKAKPLAEDAIKIILEAGGTPVLAHPIQTRGVGRTGSDEFFENMDTIIRKLKTQGLKGLECYHPDQNKEQSMRFVEIAGKYHLHVTRGSDFHGDDFAKADPTAEY